MNIPEAPGAQFWGEYEIPKPSELGVSGPPVGLFLRIALSEPHHPSDCCKLRINSLMELILTMLNC